MRAVLLGFFLVFFASVVGVQVIPVASAPEPEAIALRIAFPRDGARVTSDSLTLQFKISGIMLGVKSDIVRGRELENSPIGQYISVIIDGRPAFSVKGAPISMYGQEDNYFERRYRFSLPSNLKNGSHTIRMFPVRSFGESYKGKKVYEETFFYYNEKSPNYGVDLTEPCVIYNQPSSNIKFKENVPVLLDFYVDNCEISSDGYTVRLDLDDANIRDLDKWCPYYIYGLKKGKHKLTLQLLDKSKKAVGEKQEGTFVIY